MKYRVEPDSDIRATYGPSQWVENHDCFLRGVRITKIAIREGDLHVWCLFPDGRTMIVAEANIDVVKLKKYGGKTDGSTAQSGAN